MRQAHRPAVELLEGKSLLSAVAGLSETLTVSQASVGSGQPIVLTFTETNTSNHDIVVTDGASFQGFSVTQNGKEVWRSNFGPNPMIAVNRVLHPGQSLTDSVTWSGETNPGVKPSPTGAFVVHSVRDISGPAATVTITPSGFHFLPPKRR